MSKISQEKAKEMMKDDILILDVRTKEEYDEGHIPNAVLMPHSDIEMFADTVIDELDTPVLIYCRSGRKSSIATEILIDMGYENVYDFGGILSWKYEIVK